MSMTITKIFVWKNEDLFKACLFYNIPNVRHYIVINDRNETHEQLNEKIQKWFDVGYMVEVGLPPAPHVGFKDVN